MKPEISYLKTQNITTKIDALDLSLLEFIYRLITPLTNPEPRNIEQRYKTPIEYLYTSLLTRNISPLKEETSIRKRGINPEFITETINVKIPRVYQGEQLYLHPSSYFLGALDIFAEHLSQDFFPLNSIESLEDRIRKLSKEPLVEFWIIQQLQRIIESKKKGRFFDCQIMPAQALTETNLHITEK